MSTYGDNITIYLGTKKDYDIYHYNFTCPVCKTKYFLATGVGRYGNLDSFQCNNCGVQYHANIDDHPYPKLYVFPWNENSSDAIEKDSIVKITLDEVDHKM